jgi:hypothetical protein
MKRRLLNLATWPSLLLFVATAALGLRGYWRGDEIRRLSRQHGVYLDSARGVATLYFDRLAVNRPGVEWEYVHPDTHDLRRGDDMIEATVAAHTANGFRLLGVAVWFARPVGNPPILLRLPLWLPAVLFAVLPLVRLSRLRRRLPPGHCAACGYDLRATPDQCPECGKGRASAARVG